MNKSPKIEPLREQLADCRTMYDRLVLQYAELQKWKETIEPLVRAIAEAESTGCRVVTHGGDESSMKEITNEIVGIASRINKALRELDQPTNLLKDKP